MRNLTAAALLAIGLALAAWAPARAAPPPKADPCAHPDEEDHAVDGLAIVTSFAGRFGRMIAQGKTVGLKELRDQLADRKHHALKLTAPAKRSRTPQAIYEDCRKSVLLVGKVYKCPKCTRWHTSVASGFVVGPDGVIVTNYHVIAEGDNGDAVAARTWDGRILPIREVLAASKLNDLVVLKVDAKGLPALPVAASAPVGSQVLVISHPVSHFYTLTEGIVSGEFLRRGRTPGTSRRELAITADFAKGSSGAPVLDRTGAVVGIVRATRPVYYEKKDGVETKVQMVWKFCVPSANLLDLLREDAADAKKEDKP